MQTPDWLEDLALRVAVLADDEAELFFAELAEQYHRFKSHFAGAAADNVRYNLRLDKELREGNRK